MFKYAKIASIIAVIAIFLSGCGSDPIPEKLSKKMYTQHNMWQIKGRSYSTNYSKGIILPVNTEIQITKMNKKAIYFTANGQNFHIINVVKHTQLDSAALAERYFAPTKKDMSNFSADAKKAIMSGLIKKGMTKEEVIVSRGYPPQSLTPTTEGDMWVYQHNKYNIYFPQLIRKTVTFTDNKVSDIQ